MAPRRRSRRLASGVSFVNEGGIIVQFLRILGLVLGISLVASLAHAQQASIIGTATDETKALLPGVNVTATDQATGRVLTAITNERGEYRIANVPPGLYTI